MKPRQAGLTLIELMIAVAVLAILATVAYPLYTEQARKSRRTDARVALETIAQAQERFFTLNGSYSASLSSLSIDAAIDTCSNATTCTSEKGTYQILLSQPDGPNTFLVRAQPQGAQQDDDCTELRINQLGVREGDGNGCW